MSPMGDSAGRSAGNRMGAGARRRNTPRERALVDPPFEPRAAAAAGTKWAAWAILGLLAALVLVPVLIWAL